MEAYFILENEFGNQELSQMAVYISNNNQLKALNLSGMERKDKMAKGERQGPHPAPFTLHPHPSSFVIHPSYHLPIHLHLHFHFCLSPTTSEGWVVKVKYDLLNFVDSIPWCVDAIFQFMWELPKNSTLTLLDWSRTFQLFLLSSCSFLNLISRKFYGQLLHATSLQEFKSI